LETVGPRANLGKKLEITLLLSFQALLVNLLATINQLNIEQFSAWNKFKSHTILTGGSPAISRFRLATISLGLKFGTLVLHPVPMPSAPFTSIIGKIGTYHSGSIRRLSSYSDFRRGSSFMLNTLRVSGLKKKLNFYHLAIFIYKEKK